MDRYLREIASVAEADFKRWTEPQQLAFLINAYNACTLQLIIDHYPVKSIKDIGSFFKGPFSRRCAAPILFVMKTFPGSHVRSTAGSIWLLARPGRPADQPARIFARLDTELRDTIKWEAQVPFAVTFALLALSEFDPLAALQLSLEWGHDTDSYAQLVGAFIGVRHGAGLFPASLSGPVLERLRADYELTVDDWVGLLLELRRQSKTRRLLEETGEG